MGDRWHCESCGYEPRLVDGIPLLAPAVAEWTGEDAEYRYAELSDAESWHFWFVSRARLVAWAIGRYFPEATSFFDIGCGTGGVEAALRRLLPSLAVMAGDSQLSGLRLAKRRLPDQSFIQCDIRAMPFEREFAVTGAFDVLEHLDDDASVLREMYKVTHPGGGLIVTVPQHQWLWSAVDDFAHHRRRYARRELAGRIEGAGFQLLRMTSFMTLILPAMLWSRRAKLDAAVLDPVAELRIGRAANGAMATLCAVECAMIRTGMSLPVGGSLLVVARRPH